MIWGDGPTWMEDAVLEFMTRHDLIDVNAERPTLRQSLERLARLQEELSELTDAMRAEDRVAVADALGDLLYLIIGTFLVYNISVRPVFDEVHRSNMTKSVSNSSVSVNAKPVKGASYEPPRLKELLECTAKSKQEQ